MNANGSAQNPQWSPNGHQIVFQAYSNGQWQIGIVNAGGGGQRMLTDSFGDNTTPVWSPNGKQIAFASTRDNVSAIYVMGATGAGKKRVS